MASDAPREPIAGRGEPEAGAPGRRRWRWLSWAALSALLAAPGWAAAAGDAAAWAADLELLVESLRGLHPDPHRRVSAAAFDAERAALEARLGSLQPAAAALEMQRLLALAADGHTEWHRLPPALRGAWLPLIPRRFVEGWFVRTGDPRYRDLFGKPIVRIGETPIEDAVRRIAPYVSGDNDIGKLDGVGNLLRNARVLAALGIIADSAGSVPVTVLEGDGSETSRPVEVNDEAWVGAAWVDANRLLAPDAGEPLHRRLDGSYACAWLPDERLLWVAFHEVRDDEGSTIAGFFDRVYAFARRVEPSRLVLDIRENSGGNLDLNGPVVRGLIATPALDRPGRFFVVIGRDTYSAAMNLAVVLERLTHPLFVGEPTGGSPNHFGDTRLVALPHSGMQIEISELFWQSSDPRDRRPWITPDLPAAPSAALFFAARDPALEAILGFEPDAGAAARFGPPAGRWRRAGQLHSETWPELLEPAARPVEGIAPWTGPRVSPCGLEGGGR